MKKLSSLMLLALILLVSSCRQDILQEQETYHNTSAFRLTSQRISLDEAKHKAKLLPELQKAKKEVEKQKPNIQGKLVNIGNGIIIDTDEVIYMENGPDFHTYTFSVVRENASANAPVENILMTPQTDGSYRVFHIVLNLSETDKTKIANKEFVNFKNKSQVTELASMNLSSLAQRSNCTPEYYSYPIPCSDANYRHLPGESCELSGTSGEAYWATGVFWNCQNIPEPVDNVITPSEGGPGGGGSTDPATPPDDCITTVTNPGEVGIINESGCNTIVPSEPNIRPTQTPCEKIKNITDNTTGLKDKIKSLNTPANLALNYERGAIVADNAQGESVVNPIDGNPNETFINVLTPPTGEQTAFIHTHFEGSTMSPIFSFDDLGVFDAIHFQRFTNNKSLDKLTIMVISKAGIFALRIDNSILFYNAGGEMMTNRDNLKEYYSGELTKKINITYGDVIKQVAKVLPEFGVSLYKATDDQLNSWNKVIYDPVTDSVKEEPCN